MKNREKLANQILKGQKPLYQAFSFTQKDLDSMYSVGHNLYEQGKYQEAEDVFLNLLLMEWDNPKYAEALAVARKDQNKLFAAQMAYKHLAIIDYANASQHNKEAEMLQEKLVR